mgnify:FL=1
MELNELTRHLVELGYEKNYQAETMGEFSVRGGIIDIFPLTEETPFRIELWGDEVDSIRSFDPESQRSIENLEEIYIYPACELVLTEEERRNGVAKIQKEAEKAAEKFRKEMKTEEAYRVNPWQTRLRKRRWNTALPQDWMPICPIFVRRGYLY